MDKYEKDAKVFKAFCDTTRLRIIDLLTQGERCACVLMEEMGMAQSALSYHMKILCEAGIVKARPDGKWVHYSLDEAGIRSASDRILQITAPKSEMSCHCNNKR